MNIDNGGEEYNDEAGSFKNNLHTIIRVSSHLDNEIADNENLPEWCQEKMAVAKGMVVAVMDYIISQHEMGKQYSVESKKVKKKSVPVIKESHLPVAKSLMKDLQNFKKNS